MRAFNVKPVDESLRPKIQTKIDNLNKPLGSMGELEKLAMQVCLVQHTLQPKLTHPCHILFGADHGIEREGVSIAPRDVTWQQMMNFARGGGGVNMLCRQHGFKLRIVDMGVDHDLSAVPGILPRKIAWGTRDFLHEAALTPEQMNWPGASCRMYRSRIRARTPGSGPQTQGAHPGPSFIPQYSQ